MDTSLSITIDQEFKDLLPALDPETYRLLEENILEHGLREPLVLWKSGEDNRGILIDGHNRYQICTEHNIPFRTIEKDFTTREEVIIWIIGNQVSRRNLTPMQLSYFRGLHYQADKKIKGKNNQYAQQKSDNTQNESFHSGSTANRLSGQYNVSANTILRDAKLAEGLSLIGEISPEAKKKVLDGEVTVNKVKLETLSSASKEEIEAIATRIEEGTYTRKAPRNPAPIASDYPEIKQLNIIIKDFASNFNSMFRQLGNGGPADLKPVLRSYIDQLENLYRNIE